MALTRLQDMLAAALRDAIADGALPECEAEISLEQPPDPDLGDFSANLAMALAKPAKMAPREIAQIIIDHLPDAGGLVERVEIAGPGFINFHLSPTWLHDTLRQCLSEQGGYGRCDEGAGKRVQIEFISANPVGPLHVGNARGGPFGDALANMLAAVGYEVEREYLLNDGPDNTQFRLFGQSMQARYRELLGLDHEMPEEGYKGDYVIEYAQRLIDEHGDEFATIAVDDEGFYEFALVSEKVVVGDIRSDCELLGVDFDNWFSERGLFESGDIESKLADLDERGVTYEKDGALWLASSRFGDEEDRVLVRSTGAKTYLMTDLAYADNKFARGLDHVIYIWGPDHAAQVPSVKAGLAASGVDASQVEFIIHQIVRLTEGGEIVRMSKRAGHIVSVRDLLEDVGTDVARFMLLSRSVDSHLDFDLDIARKQSDENPVFYVQYAHARICSIQREAATQGLAPEDLAGAELALLTHPDELRLIRALADYPGEVSKAAEDRAVHRLAHLCRELAAIFHQFYNNCRVIDPENVELTGARLALIGGTRIVIANILGLLGVSAPEKM